MTARGRGRECARRQLRQVNALVLPPREEVPPRSPPSRCCARTANEKNSGNAMSAASLVMFLMTPPIAHSQGLSVPPSRRPKSYDAQPAWVGCSRGSKGTELRVEVSQKFGCFGAGDNSFALQNLQKPRGKKPVRLGSRLRTRGNGFPEYVFGFGGD